MKLALYNDCGLVQLRFVRNIGEWGSLVLFVLGFGVVENRQPQTLNPLTLHPQNRV